MTGTISEWWWIVTFVVAGVVATKGVAYRFETSFTGWRLPWASWCVGTAVSAGVGALVGWSVWSWNLGVAFCLVGSMASPILWPIVKRLIRSKINGKTEGSVDDLEDW